MEKPFKLTLRVVWWMQLMQILFALPFTVGSIFFLMAVVQGSMDSLFPSLLFGLFAFLGWANALSTIQITEKSVTVTVFYGRFRIFWDEVEKIAQSEPFIALIGNGKNVTLSLIFAGKDRVKMLEFFNQQVERRNIRFEKNMTQFPITHQNARVWW
jgi:hypothetical protein